jgi:hypothetical protein
MRRHRRHRSGTRPRERRVGDASRSDQRLRWALVGSGAAIVALSSGTLVAASSRIEREQAAYSGPAALECVPARLNASALLPGVGLTVSPMPGSHEASAHTQISMLGAPPGEIASVRVSGSATGIHRGRMVGYSQGDGASFLPNTPFHAGEHVEVRGQLDTAAGARRFAYRFTVAHPDPIKEEPQGAKIQLTPGEYQSFHSAPQLHPPNVDVTYSSPEAGPGDIFAAPYSGPGNTGPTIFEPDGQLVWMDPLPENVFASNLQLESLGGEPVLTWWQGYIPQNGFGMGEEVVANSSYQPIMRVHAGNGFKADLHDFHLEPNDTALMTVFNTIHCDLTSVSGPRDGDIIDGAFQEVDLKTGLVRREWHSIDHVPLSASHNSPLNASAEWPDDYFHINSLDPRGDGTMLISGRSTWQLYLLDERTGQVTTTVGGHTSSVKMEPGTETAWQHDAMTLPDGNISMLDNGGTPFVEPQSRGLIVELNLQKGTDTKVAEFTHPRPLQAGSQGNLQELPSGNWFVGWGPEPYFTEFDPSGRMIYDAHLPLAPINSSHGEHTNSYRAYKFEWSGTPTQPPAIAAEAGDGGLTIYASWNGATGVARWRVLGGSSPDRLALLAVAAKSGFETTIKVPTEQYVAVQALDAAGAVTGHSATVKG